MLVLYRFRRAGYAAIDRICDYYTNIEQRPVVPQVEPGFLVRALPREAPQQGESMEVIGNDFQNLILPGLTHWQHPSYVESLSSVLGRGG